MLHERILILVKYVTDVIAGECQVGDEFPFISWFLLGQAKPDAGVLRSLSALIASLPASENKYFREEFDTVRHLSVYDLAFLTMRPIRNIKMCN